MTLHNSINVDKIQCDRSLLLHQTIILLQKTINEMRKLHPLYTRTEPAAWSKTKTRGERVVLDVVELQISCYHVKNMCPMGNGITGGQ